ncbi:MAG: acetyl-CoA carboxylase biotin carboxyl carrier protein subunit [Gemmatimonadaceae bacterium]|nr:acetyl-CoA carboxylase biotin carboxyl carrier protein subunit [Gemmatimonadaceae bacterium]
MIYVVEVNGQRYNVDVREGTVIVDGVNYRASLQQVAGTPVRIVSVNDAVHRMVMRERVARGRYRLWLDGHRYDAEALDSRARAIREMQASVAKPAGPAPLRAPMPGLIVQLRVKAGDMIAAGDGLVVMEAMKMENELRAPAAGKVKAVHVIVGAAVEKGALLVELE